MVDHFLLAAEMVVGQLTVCKLSNGTTSNFAVDRSKRHRQYSQSEPPLSIP